MESEVTPDDGRRDKLRNVAFNSRDDLILLAE